MIGPPVAFRSIRNRVLGVSFIIGTVILAVAVSLPNVSATAVVLSSPVGLAMLRGGIRLIITSKVEVTADYVILRGKWGKIVKIPRDQIASIEVGSRNFLYDRSFPRIRLRSGEVKDLMIFEQATERANSKGSSVKRLIDALEGPTG
jgi:hypothetical protein